MKRFINFVKKSRAIAVATLFALTIASASVSSVVLGSQAAASSCYRANIVYCGLNGASTDSYINSFKGFYNKSSDGHYNDLRTVYNWAGANTASVSSMNTYNTHIGTMVRNGDISISGRVVATDAWVSARFGAGQNGFVKISDGVYARKTTTLLANSTNQVLVYTDKDGNFAFAVMTECGNAVKATPKVQPKPTPKPPVPAPKPPTPPAPKPPTPKPPVPTPVPEVCLECQKLTAKQNGGSQSLNYTFTATATSKNTKITSYTFDFGDGTSYRGTSSTVDHTFAKSGKYKVTVSVTAMVNGKEKTVTSEHCATCVTIVNTIKECKPGVPEGSPECQPVTIPMCSVPGLEALPADSTDCVTPATPTTPTPETPSELPNTGAGSVIGLFTAAAIGGGLFHQFVLRRKQLLG